MEIGSIMEPDKVSSYIIEGYPGQNEGPRNGAHFWRDTVLLLMNFKGQNRHDCELKGRTYEGKYFMPLGCKEFIAYCWKYILE